MSLNEEKFFSVLKKINCFEKNPHVAVGVSGGPDSIALVFLLNKWIKLKKGKLSALIFDHRIRHNSKIESFQVRAILKSLNISSVILRAQTHNLTKKNMSEARNNRLNGLINFCKRKKILHLFLGHHYDDNIETYLIRKVNGSNFEGLGSMEELSYFNQIQLLRPFIKIPKKSILTFNKKNNLVYLNDPSNKDLNYTRVKVRNFLESENYHELIRNDFLTIKKEMPFFRDMILTYFLDTLSFVAFNKLKININKLLKLDILIIERIILISLKYFSLQNFTVRSAKIAVFMAEIKKPNFKNFNLKSISIEKKDNFLVFSKK